MEKVRKELHTKDNKDLFKQKRERVSERQMAFGDSLKKIRKREGEKRGLKNKRGNPRFLSQPELAHELDISLDTLKNWEQHYNVPDMDTLLKICDSYQCDLDWLFGRIDESTHDIKHISSVTGLSADSTEKIIDNLPDFLNMICESAYYESLCVLFDQYSSALDDYKHALRERNNRASADIELDDPEAYLNRSLPVSFGMFDIASQLSLSQMNDVSEEMSITLKKALKAIKPNSTMSETEKKRLDKMKELNQFIKE